jgi:DNA repair ATPase RecN
VSGHEAALLKEKKEPMLTLKNVALSCAAAALASASLVAEPSAPSRAAALDEIAAHASKVRATASEAFQLLKNRNADFAKVKELTAALDQDAEALKAKVAEFEAANTSLTEREQRELEKLRSVALVMNVFVDNKLEILKSDDLQRQRILLRAKADGIVKRADMILQSASRLKS